jgi:hypothetical protein
LLEVGMIERWGWSILPIIHLPEAIGLEGRSASGGKTGRARGLVATIAPDRNAPRVSPCRPDDALAADRRQDATLGRLELGCVGRRHVASGPFLSRQASNSVRRPARSGSRMGSPGTSARCYQAIARTRAARSARSRDTGRATCPDARVLPGGAAVGGDALVPARCATDPRRERR